MSEARRHRVGLANHSDYLATGRTNPGKLSFVWFICRFKIQHEIDMDQHPNDF